LTKARAYLLCLLLAGGTQVSAQRISDSANRPVVVDSLVARRPVDNDRRIDSVLRLHSPRKAAIRSAMLPGLGQIYNRKYWKVPIVYAAVGIPTAMLIYNLSWYRRTRFAYTVLATRDSGRYGQIHPKLQGYVQFDNLAALQNLRNEFRRDVDYSVLFVLLFWGLNIVDASVDAHLKTFDVSPDLSLRIKPGYSEMAGTNGISLVLSIR